MRIDRIRPHGTSRLPAVRRPAESAGNHDHGVVWQSHQRRQRARNAERIRNLAQRAGIPSGLALALILKYGNDPNVLGREAAKLKREAENTGN